MTDQSYYATQDRNGTEDEITIHTPGPWRLPEGPSLYPDGIRVADEQDVTIATIWKQPYDPAEWADANARLIAAAPRMLKALELIVEILPCGKQPWEANAQEQIARETALAALSEAKGLAA